MVTTSFTKKLVQQLEKYLLQANNFQLRGEGYELLLLLPNDGYASAYQYSLLASAKSLNNRSQREVIKELLINFKSVLSLEEYTLIATLNILDSNSPLVKNININFPFYKAADTEVVLNTTIDGIDLRNAVLIRSSVLLNLVRNKKVRIQTTHGYQIWGTIKDVSRDFEVEILVEENQQNTIKFDEIDSIFEIN